MLLLDLTKNQIDRLCPGIKIRYFLIEVLSPNTWALDKKGPSNLNHSMSACWLLGQSLFGVRNKGQLLNSQDTHNLILCHSTFKTTTKITSLRSSSISAIDIRKHYSSSNITPYQNCMSYLTMPGGFHKALNMTKHESHTPAGIEQQQKKTLIISLQFQWKNPHARGSTKACLRATASPTMPSASCQLRSTSASDIEYEFNNQCHNSPIKT